MISHVRLVWKLIIMTQSVCQHVTVCMLQTVLPVPDLNSHCRCSCMCSVQWANFTIISWAHLFHLQIFRYPDIVTAVMDCSPTWLAWMTSYSEEQTYLCGPTILPLCYTWQQPVFTPNSAVAHSQTARLTLWCTPYPLGILQHASPTEVNMTYTQCDYS